MSHKYNGKSIMVLDRFRSFTILDAFKMISGLLAKRNLNCENRDPLMSPAWKCQIESVALSSGGPGYSRVLKLFLPIVL